MPKRMTDRYRDIEETEDLGLDYPPPDLTEDLRSTDDDPNQ